MPEAIQNAGGATDPKTEPKAPPKGAKAKEPLPPHLLPGQNHPADPKAEAWKDPANQLPSETAPGKKPALALLATVQESQYVCKHITVRIPEGHTPKDLMEPTYWMHNAKRLGINDKIDCISMTGQWECTLRVVNKGDTWVKMRLLSGYDAQGRDEAAGDPRDDYRIEFVQAVGYRVVHKESRAVIASAIPTKDAAIAARDAHVETMTKRQ